jgi:phage shock protein A
MIGKIFKRGKKNLEAKANEAMDKMEEKNAIPLMKQSIRDRKEKLQNIIKKQGVVNGERNRYRAEAQRLSDDAAKYHDMATKLKAKLVPETDTTGDDVKARNEEIKKAILDGLNSWENLKKESEKMAKMAEDQNVICEKLAANITEYRESIVGMEKEVAEYEARKAVVDASHDINKELAELDDNSDMAVFSRMKKNIEDKEAEVDAMTDLQSPEKSVEEKMEALLNESSPTENNELLNDFLNS